MHTFAVALPQPISHRAGAGRPILVVLAIALVVVGATVGVGTVGVGTGGSLTAAGPAPPGELVAVARRSYVVQPGDTLWSVARSLRPTGDVRPLVDYLSRQAGGTSLQVGQRIPLP